jgi:hypothetical protein
MSRENIDLVRGAVDAMNRRDIEGALQRRMSAPTTLRR